MKRYYQWKCGLAVFIIMILALTGCSQDVEQDSIEETVKTVVELQLNAPDEKALFQNYFGDTDVDFNEANDEYYTYYEETYKPYFTESAFERYMMTTELVSFHQSADRFDYQLKVNGLDVEQNEVTPTNYNFTVELDYVNKDGEVTPIKLTGVAIMRDDKIAKISYLGDKQLLRRLFHGEPIKDSQ